MLALGLYLCLSMVLVVSHGHYGSGPVLMTLGVGLALVGVRRQQEEPLDERLILSGSLVSLAILTAGNQMIYAREVEPSTSLRNLLLLTLAGVVGAVVAGSWPGLVARRLAVGLGLVGLVAMLVGKVFVLRASPQPFIDVWTSSVAAVDHILGGRNPYSQQYVDIYAGAYNYKPGMPYGPAFLLWSTGWAWLFGGQHDVRVGLCIAEALVALGLGGFTFRRTRSALTAVAVALLWATNPIGLFVLEQSWVDPLLMAALVGCLWALFEKRLGLAGVALGVAFAVKTYAVVAVGLIGLWALATFGLRGARRFIVGSVGAAVAFTLPFVVLDPAAFWNSMFGLWADQAPRADALTLTALVGELKGLRGNDALRDVYGPFNLATLALAAIAAWWVSRRAGPSPGRLAWALAAVHVWFFLFARQAFCNYYYYALVFFALALVAPPKLSGESASPT